MRIECLHGYFRFTESSAGDISRFVSLYEGLEIDRRDEHFTFSYLIDAPNFSIEGMPYLLNEAEVTFEGQPWEVMRENGLVYNFLDGEVVPITTIVQTFKVSAAGNYFVSNGLILPGSLAADGSRVTDYTAEWIYPNFRYSEIVYD